MSTSNGRRFGHAVIIGGSMAGLSAARAASDHFERVTIVERDALPTDAAHRKGVPQGHHLHGLLKRGANILTEWFPDLMSGLAAAGAQQVNLVSELMWYQFGGWKARSNVGRMDAISVTRPTLEREVRQRVRAVPNVQVLEGNVAGLAASPDKSTVQGVIFRRAGGSADETLAADLVVDASGRGTRLPAWLEALGRGKIKESSFQVDVGYATRLYKAPPEGRYPWRLMFVTGGYPDKRMGFLSPIEGGRWMCTLVGTLGEHPPTDEAGYLEFAKGLPVPDWYQAVKELEPVTDVAGYKFPSHLRRHYEAMADFPDGLAVLGDAHCSFNPIFGQGMAIAAVGAKVLSDHLAVAGAAGAGAPPRGFSRRYQQALARESNAPWTVSTTEDMRFPEVQGTRPFGTGFVLWYTKRLQEVATVDPGIAYAFYQVANMVAPASELMKPSVLFKVLKGRPNSPAARPG